MTETWKYVDEATTERQEFNTKVRKSGTWRLMPAKRLEEQMEKVFPSL